MADRVRSKDGTRDTDFFLKDAPETPTHQGREGGDLAREVGTRDLLKQRTGGSGVTRPTKEQSSPAPVQDGPPSERTGEAAPDRVEAARAQGDESAMPSPEAQTAEDVHTGVWVVIANGAKMLVLENVGEMDAPQLVVRKKDEFDNPRAQDWAANRPGRMSDSQGNKSAFDDTDWHDLEEERFAADLAQKLYEWSHQGRFDKLVLMADPTALGTIRKELHQEVKDKLLAEIDKDLTNHPIHEIEARLADDLKDAA